MPENHGDAARPGNRVLGALECLAVVHRDAELAVVGAHVEHALLPRRLGDGRRARVVGHAVVDRQHRLITLLPHDRQRRTIDAGGHVAQVLPGQAAVARTEEVLAAGVDRGRVVRRDEHRRVPVGRMHGVAEHLLRHVLPPRLPVAAVADGAGRIARADVLHLPRLRVVSLQAEELRRRIGDARILRIGHAVEAVAAAQPRPVLVENAARGPAGARAHPAAVVLEAAVDVVGMRVVDRHAVVLRERQRGDVEELHPAVVADADAAVVELHHVAGVFRVDPHEAVVAVRGRPRRRERLAAVIGERVGVQHVDALVVVRVDGRLACVHRPRVPVRHERPRARRGRCCDRARPRG